MYLNINSSRAISTEVSFMHIISFIRRIETVLTAITEMLLHLQSETHPTVGGRVWPRHSRSKQIETLDLSYNLTLSIKFDLL